MHRDIIKFGKQGWLECSLLAGMGNLRLVLELGLVRVSSRLGLGLRLVLVLWLGLLVRVSIRTSWVVNFAVFSLLPASNLI